MLKQARQKIVVADQQKIGITGTSLICPVSEMDILITNKEISSKKVSELLIDKAKLLKV